MYDATGSLDDTEALSGDAFEDLYSFYRQMFPKITDDDIEKVQFFHCRQSMAWILNRWW